jgi:hypothetical protein
VAQPNLRTGCIWTTLILLYLAIQRQCIVLQLKEYPAYWLNILDNAPALHLEDARFVF